MDKFFSILIIFCLMNSIISQVLILNYIGSSCSTNSLLTAIVYQQNTCIGMSATNSSIFLTCNSGSVVQTTYTSSATCSGNSTQIQTYCKFLLNFFNSNKYMY